MTFDFTVNVPALVTVTLALIAGIVWLVRLEAQSQSTTRDTATLRSEMSALEAMVHLHKEQFHEYQLLVAHQYVTAATIGEIKRDLINELARLEGRFEQQIDRLVKPTV